MASLIIAGYRFRTMLLILTCFFWPLEAKQLSGVKCDGTLRFAGRTGHGLSFAFAAVPLASHMRQRLKEKHQQKSGKFDLCMI